MEWSSQKLARGKELITETLKAEGLDAFAFLKPEPAEASEDIRSIVVVLFPYYAGTTKGNLSLYCRGLDYHTVVPKYLTPVGEAVKKCLGEALRVGIYADTGPLADRYLALRAGLGFVGRNQMLIHERYGSYFFIAYMTLNAPLEPDPPANWKQGIQCLDCGRCTAECPGGAMRLDGGFLPERCRSGITQKKGELESWELEILRKDQMIFGCDRCQTVCPYNQKASVSPIQEFVQGRIDRLDLEDLEGLSRRQFLEKYPNRAFTWRGPGVLRRNLQLLQEAERGGN